MSALLTAAEIKDACLDPEERDDWIRIFERHEFESLPKGKTLGITPFDVRNLGPVSYDLTVGNEAYSLRRAKTIPLSAGGPGLEIDPGETVLIFTTELLAFAPQFAAMTLSRARIMNEGIALSSAKIDPTWYGCLQIPITNNSRFPFTLKYGERFCTLLIFELHQGVDRGQYLTKENTPHLGQTTLKYEARHASHWEPQAPDTVRDDDMLRAVKLFGPPFDVVRGMLEWNRTEIIRYMQDTWSPSALQNLKYSAWEDMFKQVKQFESRLIWILLLTVLGWIALAAGLAYKLLTG